MVPLPFRYAAFLCLVFLCAGCATVSPLYVLPSDAPQKSFPPAPPAVIRLPVTVKLPQDKVLNNYLAALFMPPTNENLKAMALQAQKTGFQITKQYLLWNQEGEKLILGSTFQWLKPAAKDGTNPQTTPSPSNEKQPGNLRIGLPLTLGKDWKLEVQNPIPVVENPLMSIPATATENLKRLEVAYTRTQLDELNRVLEGISNLRPKANDIWALMQDPIYLDKGIWLLIRPESISTGVMRADAHDPFKIETVLELWAHPVIFFGDNPQEEKKPLPPLKAFEPGRPGFRAISNVSISFKEADRFLQDPRTGLIDSVIPGTGDQKLTVKGIHLYGSGGKVIAEVKLAYNPFLINFSDKPAQMTIYFRGTPRYNIKKRRFEMPDMDFDVKTSDFLVQVADWIMKSDIRKELRRKARIPVGTKLDSLKDRMGTVLNRRLNPYASLATKVKTFTILDSFADKDGIQAQVALDGDSQLNVAW